MAPKKSPVAFAVALNKIATSPQTATPKADAPARAAQAKTAEAETPAKAARGGRSRKEPAKEAAAAASDVAVEQPKKRGRPKKEAADAAAAVDSEPPQKRGRAKKEAASNTAEAAQPVAEPPLKKGKSSSGALKVPTARSATPRAVEPAGARVLRLLSVNVAGLRPVLAGDKAEVLKATVEREAPDVLCLNEHKLKGEDVSAAEEKLKELLPNYSATRWAVSTAKKGYSGVAVLLRDASSAQAAIPDPAAVVAAATEGMGGKLDEDPVISQEGRLITLELPELTLVAAYVPNSGADLQRLSYRTDRKADQCWDRALTEYVRSLEQSKGKPVVVIGDLNCAHRVQDLWNMYERPDFPDGLSAKPFESQYTGLTGLKKIPGNTPEERNSLSTILEDTGLVDTFRAIHPEASGVFSYFSQRFPQNRLLNRGLRLDYALASGSLCSHLQAGQSAAGADTALPRVLDSFLLDEADQVADHSAVGCWIQLPPVAGSASAAAEAAA